MLRRLLVGSTTGLTLLFVLPMLFIRAQPYDSGHLGQFFAPLPDCPAPCFMGVRPRHTTVLQALAILRANDSTEHVRVERAYPGQSIYWRWGHDLPVYRDYAFQSNDANVISGVTLPGTVTLGEVALVLGPPERITAAVSSIYRSRAMIVMDYPSRGLYLLVSFYPCDIDQRDYWQFRLDSGYVDSFTIGLGNFIYGGIRPDDRLELDPAVWAKQLRDFCKAS